ncbi:MAG: 50S ribosomal protein L25/general stress protein Ctc [Microcoleaceae cyanobacterium]
MELTVECQKRPEGSKPNALRRSGLIPAVLYGHNGAESLSLTINAKSAETLLKSHALNSILIQLNIPDLSWSGKTLLREVQRHPWKGNTYHPSFFAVGSHGFIDVEVPLHFVGEAVGVKMEGGILDTVLNQLKISCPPDSIPEFISVDVSGLHLGQALHINELNLPSGVTASGEANQVVVSILSPQGGSEGSEEG